MTITCGIQPTNIVTMVMKVLHNSCNMYTFDFTDMVVWEKLVVGNIHKKKIHGKKIFVSNFHPQKI